MRVGTKLIAHTVIVAVFSVFISTTSIGWMVYTNAKKFLEEAAIEKFVSLRDSKAEQIREYYNNIGTQIVAFANDRTIVQATQDFSAAFNEYTVQTGINKYKLDAVKNYINEFAFQYAKLNDGYKIDAQKILNLLDDQSFALQYNYIVNNPNSIASKSKFNGVKDGSKYSVLHEKIHPIIRACQEKFKLQDILIVEPNTGDIIYSVQKNLDYTTSLINGPYAQSVIGHAFLEANTNLNKGNFVITDFSAYMPAYNNAAAFAASPIFDEADKKIGVLIFRLSTAPINNIMTNNGAWGTTWWGKTGEAYIIGKDYIMRTNSRFFVEDPENYIKQMHKLAIDEQTLRLIQVKGTTIGLQKIESVGAKNVVAGQEGIAFYNDYRQQSVLAAYEPLHIPGLDWGIICGIDTAEAFVVAHVLAHKVIFYSIAIIILISAIAIFIGFKLSRLVSEPLEKLKNIIYFLAKKQDLTKRIKVDTDDELGDIAHALNILIANLQQVLQGTVKVNTQVQSATSRLSMLNTSLSKEIMEDEEHNIPLVIHEEVKATEETLDSLQILSSRLEDLSQQFKLFEEESERTSGW